MTRVRFGSFVVDVTSGELWRGEQLVPIQQKPFRLLVALLERPGRVVTRDDLRSALWSGTTHVAFDRGVTVAMAKLRQALGDSVDAPQFIETLPGRGYRLIVVVTPADEVPRSASRTARSSSAAGWIAATLAVTGLLVLGPAPAMVSATDRLAAAEQLSAYACVLKQAGRFEEGLSVIRKAHALAPEVARYTAEVGLHLHANRRYDEEMQMLDQAVAQDPASAPAWFHLGLGLARRARMADAVAALERAAVADPADAGVRWWLTWARSELAQSGTIEPRGQASAEESLVI
jgi:DNA-binding winged helix-turn-helix (wHTH) protein